MCVCVCLMILNLYSFSYETNLIIFLLFSLFPFAPNDGHYLCAYRNSETTTNYVDRVRVRDTNSSFGGPGRGSGWRQKSLSNIDLSTSHRFGGGSAGAGGIGFGHFRYRDYDSGLYDLYTKTDNRLDYEDIYGVNPKGNPLKFK